MLRHVAAAAALALAATAAAAEAITVAALGDSLTQGYGLPAEEGLVPQLQAWLDARAADAEVLNAGVSGDTSAGGAARVDWTLTDEVDAMIVALGGNDVLRGIDPAVTRGNIASILEATDARGIEVLLVGLEAPGNYGPNYKAAFDAIWPELAATHGALLADSFFAALEAGGTRQEALAAYMQPDGIHPNAAGVERIVEALGPRVLKLVERARAGEPAATD